jgi:hypothetical protein
VQIVKDGVLQAKIDSVVSFEFTHELDIQEEEFLGETSPEFDSIFKGTSFRIEMQLSSRQVLDLQVAIIDKAKRRAAGAQQIDIQSVLIFPNGDTFQLMFPDCSFGSTPVNIGGRSDFVTVSLEGSTSGAKEF